MTLTFHYRNSLLQKHFSVEFRAEKAHWNSLRKRIKALRLAGRNRYFTFTFPHRVQISSPQGQNRTHFHSLTSLLLIRISYHCKSARDRSNSTQRGVPNRWRSHQHVARCTDDATVPKAKISTTKPKSPLRFGMIGWAANRKSNNGVQNGSFDRSYPRQKDLTQNSQ